MECISLTTYRVCKDGSGSQAKAVSLDQDFTCSQLVMQPIAAKVRSLHVENHLLEPHSGAYSRTRSAPIAGQRVAVEVTFVL